jgi:hypothetical protein
MVSAAAENTTKIVLELSNSAESTLSSSGTLTTMHLKPQEAAILLPLVAKPDCFVGAKTA